MCHIAFKKSHEPSRMYFGSKFSRTSQQKDGMNINDQVGCRFDHFLSTVMWVCFDMLNLFLCNLETISSSSLKTFLKTIFPFVTLFSVVLKVLCMIKGSMRCPFDASVTGLSKPSLSFLFSLDYEDVKILLNLSKGITIPYFWSYCLTNSVWYYCFKLDYLFKYV